MSWWRSRKRKVRKHETIENAASSCGETFVKTTVPKNNSDLRAAIVDVLSNDAAIMQTLLDAVSDALVTKLLASKDLIATLADKLVSNGTLDRILLMI